MRNFIGKTIGGLSQKYFSKIVEKCKELNIYTYEVSSTSPANTIFYPRQKVKNLSKVIHDKHISIKELIIELINTKENNNFMRFLKSIPPIGIDPALYNEYLEDLIEGRHNESLIDEVDAIYNEEQINIKDRLCLLECVGNSRIIFDEDDYEETE